MKGGVEGRCEKRVKGGVKKRIIGKSERRFCGLSKGIRGLCSGEACEVRRGEVWSELVKK